MSSILTTSTKNAEKTAKNVVRDVKPKICLWQTDSAQIKGERMERGEKPKRFMLFSYKGQPLGGMYDMIGTYNTRVGAIKSWRGKEKDGWEHGHILDRTTGGVIVPEGKE